MCVLKPATVYISNSWTVSLPQQTSGGGTTLLRNNCSSTISPNTAGVKMWNGFIKATTSCTWSMFDVLQTVFQCAPSFWFRFVHLCRIVVDLKEEVWYQKCHDPDCRNFRSSSMLWPLELPNWPVFRITRMELMIPLWGNNLTKCVWDERFSSYRLPTATGDLCQLHHDACKLT